MRTKDIDVVAGMLKEPEIQFLFYNKVVLLMFWILKVHGMHRNDNNSLITSLKIKIQLVMRSKAQKRSSSFVGRPQH